MEKVLMGKSNKTTERLLLLMVMRMLSSQSWVGRWNEMNETKRIDTTTFGFWRILLSGQAWENPLNWITIGSKNVPAHPLNSSGFCMFQLRGISMYMTSRRKQIDVTRNRNLRAILSTSNSLSILDCPKLFDCL